MQEPAKSNFDVLWVIERQSASEIYGSVRVVSPLQAVISAVAHSEQTGHGPNSTFVKLELVNYADENAPSPYPDIAQWSEAAYSATQPPVALMPDTLYRFTATGDAKNADLKWVRVFLMPLYGNIGP